ncbi:MAG: MerR family transcriptional regulator [Nitrospirae bacterium]|nr:MerR family transcriptional regulator [Nitrospirota bacterium]
MKYLTIGQLAKKAGVNIDTIRYYEKQGLIPKPSRRESGYRQYSQDSVKRILFIKRAKDLGFSLKEIFELLSLRLDSRTKCGDVKKRADIKIAEIEGKIQTLRRMNAALVKLVKACEENKQAGECPILEALDMNGGENL